MSALEIRNLRKSFGGLEVISNIDLTVPFGERHALIGPNGAGKTTLFNLVTGWLTPTQGEIRIGGQVIGGKPDVVTRAGLARSFQKNTLLDGLTVLENLRIACQANHPSRRSLFRSPSDFKEVLAQSLRVAQQMHLVDLLGRNVKELSYGQKRQLEVAVALCSRPRILLMDEPAAGTSPAERAKLIALINALPRNLTILLVEHDMDVVFATCEIVTVLSYGKVLATGSRREIQDNPAVVEAYLGHRNA